MNEELIYIRGEDEWLLSGFPGWEFLALILFFIFILLWVWGDIPLAAVLSWHFHGSLLIDYMFDSVCDEFSELV